jgi:hypothetical protein
MISWTLEALSLPFVFPFVVDLRKSGFLGIWGLHWLGVCMSSDEDFFYRNIFVLKTDFTQKVYN